MKSNEKKVVRIKNNELRKLEVKNLNNKRKQENKSHAENVKRNDDFYMSRLSRLASPSKSNGNETKLSAKDFKNFQKKYSAYSLLGMLTINQQIIKFEKGLTMDGKEVSNLVSKAFNESVIWHKENQFKVTEAHKIDGQNLHNAFKNNDFRKFFKVKLTTEIIAKLNLNSSLIAFKNIPELFTTELHKINTERFLKDGFDRWNNSKELKNFHSINLAKKESDKLEQKRPA